MTIEILILALASSIRPTSLAAVYAIVSAKEPRLPMAIYTAAGLIFTISFGFLVVWAFHGIDINSGSDRTKGIAEIVAGVVAVVFAALLQTGRITVPRAGDAPKLPSRWTSALESHLTLRTAAAAGPLTHIPGLFYLIALNVIVSADPKVPRGLVALLVYNAIWFALPIAALVICIFKPSAARELVEAVTRWVAAHLREILIGVSYVVGGALLARGALTI